MADESLSARTILQIIPATGWYAVCEVGDHPVTGNQLPPKFEPLAAWALVTLKDLEEDEHYLVVGMIAGRYGLLLVDREDGLITYCYRPDHESVMKRESDNALMQAQTSSRTAARCRK